MSRIFRDAVLGLAREHPFARRLVNSGRLSTPSTHADSPLNTRDDDAFAGLMVPGAAACDAPVIDQGRPGWLLDRLGGRFVAMRFLDADEAAARVPGASVETSQAVRVDVLHVAPGEGIGGSDAIGDVEGLVAARYDAKPGTTYLFRPDQHVCARWRSFDPAAIRAAATRAIGHS
jgi:3-(3-hydroxy-phenyl)propionate hydroxylase